MTDDPADRPDRITTDDGVTLEVAWSAGDERQATRAIVVLTHPHPRYGGDMDNLVPAALARALPAHDIAALRVNFRGVGASSGTHGGGTAEIADVEAAIGAAATAYPDVPVVGVGYSFGADVLLAADPGPLAWVVAVAPPLAVLPLDELRRRRGTTPTSMLSPVHDQFRPADDATSTVADWPGTKVFPLPGADHFMAGATSDVVDHVVSCVDEITGRRD